jgi:hypothetical protein
MRRKYEKPRKTNPHKLTIKQHVLPVRSIRRFTSATGKVFLCDVVRQKVRPAGPADDMFVARRAWDQRAEAGYMKKIEDAFQPLADSIIEGRTSEINGDDAVTVSNFYALWYFRARRRDPESEEIQLKGIIGGGGLSKVEEENAEMNGYSFSRADGRMPARFINGVTMQVSLYRYSRHIQATAQWGILRTDDGEFVVPDTPENQIIPIAPQLALAAPAAGGLITFETLVKINQNFMTTSQRYFFAHDITRCPH